MLVEVHSNQNKALTAAVMVSLRDQEVVEETSVGENEGSHSDAHTFQANTQA